MVTSHSIPPTPCGAVQAIYHHAGAMMARLYIPHSICSWHSCITFALLTPFPCAFALSSSHSRCFALSSFGSCTSSSFSLIFILFISVFFSSVSFSSVWFLLLPSSFQRIFSLCPYSSLIPSFFFTTHFLFSYLFLLVSQEHFHLSSATVSSSATFLCISCFSHCCLLFAS